MIARKDKDNKYAKSVSFRNAKSPLRHKPNKESNSLKKNILSPRSPQKPEEDAVLLLLDRGYELRRNLMKFTLDNDESGSNDAFYSSKSGKDMGHVHKSNLDEAVVDFLIDPEDNHEERYNSDESYFPTDDDMLSDVDDPLHDESILRSLFYSEEVPEDQSLIDIKKKKTYIGKMSSIENQLPQERIVYLKKVRFIRVFVDSLQLCPNVKLPTEDAFNKRKYYLMFEFLKPSISGRRSSVSMSTDAIKVSAKTIISNELHFGNRSVFPWKMEQVSQCQGLMIIFTLYHKLAKNPKLDLIGNGRLELDHIIRRTTTCETNIAIRSKKSVSKVVGITYDGRQANKMFNSDEYDFGQLKLKVDLVSSSTIAKTTKVATNSDVQDTKNLPFEEKQQHFDIADLGLKAYDENTEVETQKSGPIKQLFPENSQEQFIMPTMHCLLSVYEGKFAVAAIQNTDAKHVVLGDNLYLKCRLFWSKETIQSDVCWNTNNPVFTFACVTPVTLSSDLLHRTQNNFMVIEIIRKNANRNPDELVGICKLPLHLFYLYFCDQNILKSLLQSKHAVIAVDDWVPALNIFNGEVVGSLKVLLAMGTSQQIKALEKHNYKMTKISVEKNDRQHGIEIAIKGCETLLLPRNSVWGECDCYVQYFFPAMHKNNPGVIYYNIIISLMKANVNTKFELGQLSLELHRTLPKLCKPDVGMNYLKNHTLTSASLADLRHILLKAFSRTGMIFQLWCKYYFPAEQEFIFAEAHLPIGNIIEVIEDSSTKSGEFCLALKYMDTSLYSDGGVSKLHVGIKYNESWQNNTITCDVQDDMFNKKVGKCVQTEDWMVQSTMVNQVSQTSLPWGETIYPEKVTDTSNIHTEIASPDNTEQTFLALLSVERGSGLSFVNSSKGEVEPPNTIVCFQCSGYRDIKSNVVLRSCSPQWNFRIETELPYHTLSNKKELVFKVCCVADSSEEENEQLLGFSSVDVTPLAAGMLQIHGWYNLINLQGECKGQLLVLIRPLEELDFNSALPVDGGDIYSSANAGKFSSCSNYNSFPSHISRFPEQRIRINYIESSDDFMRPTRDVTEDSSRSFLAECLKKNLSELDIMQKYLHDNLSDRSARVGRVELCPARTEARLNNLSATIGKTKSHQENCTVAEECHSDDSVIDNNTIVSSNAEQLPRHRGEKSRLAAAIFQR